MTGTDVAIRSAPSGGLALRGDQLDWTDAQRAALTQIGIAEAPLGDQQVFLHVAQRVGLDPFAKQIYLIGRKDDKAPGGKAWTIQTGIDGFRVFSERHPAYGGELGAEWCGEDGVWHDVWVGSTPPVAARFTVLRKDREHPIRAVAHYNEYVQTKFNGDPNHMWATKPAGQLAKCAEALARRRAFPQDLSSVYTDEEMGHVDNPPPTIVQVEAERPSEPNWDALIAQHEAARDVGKLWDLRKLAQGMRPNDGPLLNRIAEAWTRTKKAAASSPDPAPAPAPTPSPAPARPPEADATTQPALKSQMNRIFALLKKRGIGEGQRLAAASMALQRDIASFKDLSADDASRLIARLETLEEPPDDPPAEQPPAEPTATEGS